MKKRGLNLKSGAVWLVLLLISNLFYMFVMWLIEPNLFEKIIVMNLLFAVTIVVIGYFVSQKKQRNQLEMIETFLANPDEETKQMLLNSTDKYWHSIINNASSQMIKQAQKINEKQLELLNYQEFIEAWTHEIKTPLSLATLILDNREDEMSHYVYKRFKHVRFTISEDVEKILYYARLFADHKDSKFERIDLSEILDESLEDFREIAQEQKIDLQLEIQPLEVVSDKRILKFMIAQLLSNAFKYTDKYSGVVSISTWQENGNNQKTHLIISDNGKGVSLADLPFLFDKGFTGDFPDRQNATGIGLYLTKKYAYELSVEVKILEKSTTGKGFGIELIFPNVE